MTTSVCPLAARNNDHDNDTNNNNNNSKTANTKITTTTTQTAQPHLPLNARRRPQNLKFSLFLLAIFMCQLQQFAGGGCGCGGFAMAAPAPTATPTSTPTQGALSRVLKVTDKAATPNRTRRVQKRHGNYISFTDRFRLELNSTALDWSNGCGGNWTGPEQQQHPNRMIRPQKRCAKHKKLLRTLQNKTGRELRQLKADNKLRHSVNSHTAPDTADNQAIDISQRNQYEMQSSSYNFLPRLNTSAPHMLLRRVHHDLQFYVAAFSYLRHSQLHFDFEFLRKQSVLSSELLRYRNSARNILCFVEEAINSTIVLYAPSQNRKGKKLPLGKIKTISRSAMEKRLSMFASPLIEAHRQAVLAAHGLKANTPQEPKKVDAVFLKYQYMQYLKQMTQLLANHRKRNCTNTSTRPSTGPRSTNKSIKSHKIRPKGA